MSSEINPDNFSYRQTPSEAVVAYAEMVFNSPKSETKQIEPINPEIKITNTHEFLQQIIPLHGKTKSIEGTNISVLINLGDYDDFYDATKMLLHEMPSDQVLSLGLDIRGRIEAIKVFEKNEEQNQRKPSSDEIKRRSYTHYAKSVITDFGNKQREIFWPIEIQRHNDATGSCLPLD